MIEYKTYLEIKEFIELYNCKLITNKIIKKNDELKIKFSCDHINNVTFEQFKKWPRCRICQKENNYLTELNKKSQEKVKLHIEQILLNNEFKFISFPNGYKNRNSYIQYTCKYGHFNQHKIREFIRSPSCRTCILIKMSESQIGSKGNNWQGGLTDFTTYIQRHITWWKREAMEASNFLCIISGEPCKDVHHVYSLDQIKHDAFKNLGIEYCKNIGDLSEEIFNSIVEEVVRLHKLYPGVALSRKIHKLFHKLYGNGNNTPSQFEEFKQRIASGEIILN